LKQWKHVGLAVMKLIEKAADKIHFGRAVASYYLIALMPGETGITIHERIKYFVNP